MAKMKLKDNLGKMPGKAMKTKGTKSVKAGKGSPKMPPSTLARNKRLGSADL